MSKLYFFTHTSHYIHGHNYEVGSFTGYPSGFKGIPHLYVPPKDVLNMMLMGFDLLKYSGSKLNLLTTTFEDSQSKFHFCASVFSNYP